MKKEHNSYCRIAPFYGITKFDLSNKTNYFLFHQITSTSRLIKRRQLLLAVALFIIIQIIDFKCLYHLLSWVLQYPFFDKHLK